MMWWAMLTFIIACGVAALGMSAAMRVLARRLVAVLMTGKPYEVIHPRPA